MKKGVIVALLILGEAMIFWTHPEEARAVARWVYVTGWNLLPPIQGAEMPDRFAK